MTTGEGIGTGASKTTPPAAKVDDKKTITLTFEGADLALHTAITKKAADEDRSASIELLRFVRQNFGK